jgi:hypothetical protein
MPNWCYNKVEFMGEAEPLKCVQHLFEEMAKKERIENGGQLPSFIHAKRGNFFNICWEDGALSYQTLWNPNVDVIIKVAVHYNLRSVHRYEEYSCHLFGEVIYPDDLIVHPYLIYGD